MDMAQVGVGGFHHHIGQCVKGDDEVVKFVVRNQELFVVLGGYFVGCIAKLHDTPQLSLFLFALG